MSIADQVHDLEHDHAAALAQIEALNADRAALSSANASLQRDLVAAQLEINDMKSFVDDTRAMAEQLAESAMAVVRASRRQVGTPAEVVPFAPKPKSDGDKLLAMTKPLLRARDLSDEQLSDHVADVAIADGHLLTPEEKANAIAAVKAWNPVIESKAALREFRRDLGRLIDTRFSNPALDAMLQRQTTKRPELAMPYGGLTPDDPIDKPIPQNNDPEPPAQQAVTEIMAGDSGDEHKPTPGFVAHDLYRTGDIDAPDAIKDSRGEVVLGLCKKCGRAEIELADRCDAPLVRDDYLPGDGRHRDTAPVGFTHCAVCADPPSCRGVCRAGPTHIGHDQDGLPIFLKSGTAPAERQIFA